MRTRASVLARARTRMNAVMVLALAAGLVWGLPPAPAVAVPGDGDVAEQPLDGRPVVSQPPPAMTPMSWWSAPGAPVWPSAGSARLDLLGSGAATSFGTDGGVGVQGSASPGGLPVTVTVPGSGDSLELEQRMLRGLPATSEPVAVSSVDVSTLDQSAAAALGVRGVVFTLANAGLAADAPAPVRVRVGYGAFAKAYGGNFGERLRLVMLPACAITTPQVRECRIQTGLADSANDRLSAAASATVDLGTAVTVAGAGPASRSATDTTSSGSGAVVLALAAGSSSETGDWAATPMSQATSWQSGGSSGDFSYSVPINVPPAPGGLVPQISMDYSSGSIDGLTKSKNSQSSWVGEGWDYHPGYVERSYRPCRDDGRPGSGDMCWVATSPVTLVLNGKSTRLIDLGAGGWKAESDSDGWRVQRLTGVDNYARDGEAFKVTTADGTQYFFGSRRPGGPGEDGNSNGQYGGVLQMEVFGNEPGEPCYHSGGFHLSHCTMPYRWNLDRVVDVHGNFMNFEWWRHRGSYGGNSGADVFAYDIYGRLTDIFYGGNQTLGTVPTGRVQFFGQFRCFDTDTNCNNNLSLWPDVPWDQFCALNASSCGQTSPTFFNIYRLYLITTFVLEPSSGTWMQVARWQNGQGFPTNSDGTSPSLWLNNVWRPGFTNPLTMNSTPLENRVDKGTGKPATIHHRVGQINTGVGGTVNVLYSGQECSGGSPVSQVDYNAKRCFPQNSGGSVSWWHKYVATDVYLGDHEGGGQFQRWHYDYNAAWSSTDVLWKHDQSWHTPPQYRTWSRWAGYPTVVTTYSEYSGIGPKQVTETLYFRGLNLDWTITGGANTKQVTLNDNWVFSRADDEALAGHPARTLTWDGPINAGRTNWTSATRHYYTVTNTGTLAMGSPNPDIVATRVRENDTFRQTWPTYRETRTTTEYESGFGLPTRVIDYGDTDISTDDRCVHTEYAPANMTAWLISLPKQTWTTSCAANPTATDVLALTRTSYDGLNYGATPTRGLATRTEAIKAATAYPLAAADLFETARFTYDTYGRAVDSYDALNRQTTTAYTPATGGPVTQMTVTGPSIGGQRWSTVTSLDPKFGVPTKVVDVNGKETNAEYDDSGRLAKVWKDNRAKTLTPNLQYTYYTGSPTAVSTKTLGPDGQQLESLQIFDGLQRPRQTQTVSATGTGRAVTDTMYNGIGQIDKTSAYYLTGAPSNILTGLDDKDIKTQQRFVYDNHGRTTNTQQWAGNGTTAAMLWQTITGYDADTTITVTPPAGGTAITTINNARGKTIQLRQHTGATPATPVYATTNYTYDRRGQLTAVTDTAANTWEYTYDLLGRKTSTVDPDAGESTITYDNAGQVTSTTDGRGQALYYIYDNLGRKTELHQDSPTGTKRATWTYDTAVFHTVPATSVVVKGQLASATRHEGGQNYIQAVDSYDDGYRPKATTTTAPGFGTGGGTLTYTVYTDYKANGAIQTTYLPAIGGLPAENIWSSYFPATGLPDRLTTTHSQNTYIDTTYYHYDGPLYRHYLGTTGNHARTETKLEAPGRRMSSTSLHTETPNTPGDYGTAKLANDYTYDPAGNITAIRNTDNTTGTSTTDQECFRYDHLRRLTEAWTQTATTCTTPQRTGTDPYWRQWTFDTIGNRLTQRDKNPTSGDTTWTYTVGDAGTIDVEPHQIQSITTTGANPAPTRTFAYDTAGNTTSRTTADGATQTLTWDIEGHLATITQGTATTSYLYDTEGRRLVATETTTQGTKKTLYLADGTELEITTPGSPLATRYYSGVAVRGAFGLRWTTTDHHGTGTAQIDSITLDIQHRRSMPYGEDRTATPADWKGTKGYVGGTKDPSGLTHLSAREYDPSLGRFISVDPVMDLGDPQQWNAYSYSNNNPTTWSDPDGLMTKTDGGGGGLGHNYQNVDGVISYETGYGVLVTINTNTGHVCAWSVCGTTTGGWADIPNADGFLVEANRRAGSGHYDTDSTAGQLRIAHAACVEGNLAGANHCSGMFESQVGDYANEAMVAEWDPTRWSDFVKSHPGLVEAAQAAGGGALVIGLKLMKGGGNGNGPSGQLVRYDPDVAIGQLTSGGTAKASELVRFGESQGWTRSQTPNGPIKYTDQNGVVRLTIKRGSSRTPGSESPHVEIRNASGERIDPYGNSVTRRSPGNHTSIEWDLS